MASVASNDDTLFLSTLEIILLSMLGETMEKIVVSNSLLRYLFVLVWSYRELILKYGEPDEDTADDSSLEDGH